MNTRNNLALIVIGLIVLGILTNCNQPSEITQQTSSEKISRPSPTFTPTILTATVGSRSPRPAASLTAEPVVVTPSPVSPTATNSVTKPGPLPKLLTQIPLAPPGETLTDFLLDRDAARIYVTDTTGQLHVLAENTYAKIATLPTSGQRLTLDTTNQRLYVAPPYAYDSTGVTIVDTNSLTVVGVIPVGVHVTVDTVRNRFYSNRGDDPSIHLYDGVTLEDLGQVPQQGIPVYNPLRDELYLVDNTVYIVDSETLAIKADLLPDITAAQPFPHCNGCKSAWNVDVFPDHNLLVVEIGINSAGKGGGTTPQPRFFEATTLAELTDLAQLPAVEYSCYDRKLTRRKAILAEPVVGHIYRGDTYLRYTAFANLLVYDLAGNLVSWRDGLPLGITNSNTRQMYISYPLRVLVLDLPTLSPLGTLPPLSCLFLDQEMGRIYAFQNENLLIFSQSGGQDQSPTETKVETLSKAAITLIQPSPNYGHDQTLFLYQANRLYRSQDRGLTWGQLRNGLPKLYEDGFRGLTLSPDFEYDRTLFTYGYLGDYRGMGVYRSIDGGDTWQPIWNGLSHLRVYDVLPSPNYATDGTLLAYARYHRVASNEYGHSLFRSTDQGLNWTLVMTASNEASLPSTAANLLPAVNEPAIRFRTRSLDLERSSDSGRTWERVMSWVHQVVPSPRFATDQTLYVLDRNGELFRSMDGGETWQRWKDERLPAPDDTNELTAMAISPVLDNGQYQLFIGTAAGEFWSLDPTEITWEPL
jgi:hypothetical protein